LQISREDFVVKNVVSSAIAFPRRRVPSWSAQTLVVFTKDLMIERATGEIVLTTGFFGVLVAILASLAVSSGPEQKEELAPAVLWLSVTFAAVLGLGRTWQREREEGALKGLVVSPLARSAIFAGKALGVFVFIGAVELVVIPTAALLFGFDLIPYALPLLIIASFANVGVAATGTLFGAMTVRTRVRDVVLASVLLPLLTPTLGSATAATRELFGGASLRELGDYLELMGVFDVVFCSAGLGLFGVLLEG
jgi:heme exporter protein B